tara:strand:- start:19 stop:633 length:615 start_codon:yes stop_codon:yes gene_type:complete
MKKIFIILILFTFIFSNIEATTKDGKPVLLKSDGTWEFIQGNKNIDSEDFGIWKLSYFVDDFGDPTNKGYIRNESYIKGRFSNSATTNSDLDVRFIITKDNVSIKLYEYGGNHPIKGRPLSHTYTIFVKHNGKIAKAGKRNNKDFYGSNYSDRMSIRQSKDFLKLLLQGGEFKIKIKENDSSSQYNFTINADGFSNVYKKITEE